MKKISTLLFLTIFGFAQAQQAFVGKGDRKVNIGANIQDGGSGIQASVDFGLGENISYGVVSSYLLGADSFSGQKPGFKDCFDFKIRLNANLSSVLNISEAFDLYPGLNLSLRNFGGHIGTRYFLTNGFGLFSEINFPISKYSINNPGDFDNLNNQFTFSIGASFNL